MAWTPQPIVPPWKGVVDNIPSLVAEPSSFQTAVGFWIDKQRLKSVPLTQPIPVWAGAGPFIGMRSFTDAIGNLHTIVFTATQAYYYVNGVYDADSIPPLNSSLIPMATEVYQNVLFATNGSSEILKITGGSNNSAFALPNSGTCYFLGKLAGRMLYLNLIEPGPGTPGASNYPRRFRWSAVNDAQNFTDFTSGVDDIPEIEDNITGYAAQGNLGYIYRNQGLSIITPTGTTAPSFFIEQYSGKLGVGCFYPYSLAQWGNRTCFAAQDAIYTFDPLMGPMQAIGGAATRSIYTDLNNISSYAVGAFIPAMGDGITNLQYWLACPFADFTSRVWMYSFDSQTWMSQMFPFNVTGMGNVVLQ